jgi:hypothetical protein
MSVPPAPEKNDAWVSTSLHPCPHPLGLSPVTVQQSLRQFGVLTKGFLISPFVGLALTTGFGAFH